MTTLAAPMPVAHTQASAQQPTAEARAGWGTLYRIAGFAALLVVALVPLQMAVFVFWPPPTAVAGWFELFRMNPVVGILDLDLLLIVDYVLLVLVFLALFVALRHASPSLGAIFVALQLVAAATYFASATAFEMLAASDLYWAASSDAERALALAVGQVMLLTWQGTTFGISYVLSGSAMLIAAVAMLRSGLFARRTAYIGVAGGLLSIVPATAGTVGLVSSLASLIPLWAWLLLTGRALLRMPRV